MFVVEKLFPTSGPKYFNFLVHFLHGQGPILDLRTFISLKVKNSKYVFSKYHCQNWYHAIILHDKGMTHNYYHLENKCAVSF